MKALACSTVVTLGLALSAPVQSIDPRLSELYAQVGLTAQERSAIDAGQPVAKVLSWGGPSEMYVFGAIHIDGPVEKYLSMARDVGHLAGTPGYLATGDLPATAKSADLSGLSLEADDIKALKTCREGDCDVQLPSSSIATFKSAVNWSQPDVSGEVNGLARGMVLDLVHEYRRGGNTALGVYRDKDQPARVADQFAAMVNRASKLPEFVPELRQFLLEYPEKDLRGGDNFFDWEKVNFGLKPTIRVNHGVIYRPADGSGSPAVAIK